MAYRYIKDIWASLRQLANADIWQIADSGSPTNGTSGTGAGFTGPGSLYFDTATGAQFRNVGTKASPVWKSEGGVSGHAGLGTLSIAKMTWDAAVDSLVVGTVIPTDSPTIPIKAVIVGGVIDITTTLTSGGSSTIALGLGSGAQAASIKAALAVASWTAGFLAMLPLFTAASYVKVAAAAPLSLTIATADLLTGKFDVTVYYSIGN